MATSRSQDGFNAICRSDASEGQGKRRGAQPGGLSAPRVQRGVALTASHPLEIHRCLSHRVLHVPGIAMLMTRDLGEDEPGLLSDNSSLSLPNISRCFAVRSAKCGRGMNHGSVGRKGCNSHRSDERHR
jgi:hypothetical protein